MYCIASLHCITLGSAQFEVARLAAAQMPKVASSHVLISKHNHRNVESTVWIKTQTQSLNTTTEPKKRGLHFDKSRLVSETSNKEILLEYICSEFQSRLLSSQGLANFSTDSETYVILVSCRQQNIKISKYQNSFWWEM